MARRWTPQRLVLLRRIRVAACAGVTVAATVGMFLFTARKTVALTVNGETTTVTTYAMSAQRLLESQGITLKTHDIVESSAGGDRLTDRSVVTVRSAYQTTITIDGQRVPFWTTATSAEQLLSFFEQNEAAAAKVTVDIGNVYNKLTGGFVINENGPVTVIADGKSSEAPNGKLPAASILDAKGITLGKDDRVSVEKDGGTTILRVQRVTHGQETRTVAVPHGTQTILDPNLEPGQTEIRQQGEDGETKQVFDVTYVDGHAESETLISETTTKIAIDTIVAVGPERAQEDSDGSADSGNGTTGGGTGDSSESGADDSSGSKDNTGNSGNAGTGDSNAGNSGNGSGNAGGSGNTGSGSSGNSNGGSSGNSSDNSGSNNGSQGNSSNGTGNTGSTGNNSGNSGGSNNSGNTGNSGNSSGDNSNNNSGGSNGNNNSGNSGNGSNNNSGGSSGGNSGSSSDDGSATARLWHPTAAQAQTYAAGAAAQRGWTGDEWTALVKLWTRESNWRWSAENQWSGAYGIPQALPGSKMAAFGADWRNDAAIQIDWGLYYIAQRYGTPSEAWRHSEEVGWY